MGLGGSFLNLTSNTSVGGEAAIPKGFGCEVHHELPQWQLVSNFFSHSIFDFPYIYFYLFNHLSDVYLYYYIILYFCIELSEYLSIKESISFSCISTFISH